MANYIDGFVLPVRRDRLNDYQRLVERVAEIWKEHGALDYLEYVGDDMNREGTSSFTDLVAAADDETIVFGWVVFDSREARDVANEKVAADPRMADLVDSSNAGIDAKRMAYGGFRSLVRSSGANAGQTGVRTMSQGEPVTTLGPPVPELPVADVERAQQHYRDAFGFEIGWLNPGKEIGAVSRGDTAIFFRRRSEPFEPAVHWTFAADIDATYNELRLSGARIVEPLEKKPWGLRQFTVEDIDGNRFYFHCD